MQGALLVAKSTFAQATASRLSIQFLSSFTLIPPTMRKIKVLVFGDTDDSADTILEFLANATLSVSTLIYISDNPDNRVKAQVLGLGGAVVPEEIYLTDKDLLEELIEDHSEYQVGTAVATTKTSDILDGFLDSLSSGTKEYSPQYLMAVANESKAIEKSLTKTKKELALLSTAGAESLKAQNKELDKLKKELEKNIGVMQAELENLNNLPKTFGSSLSRGPAVSIYPPYSYKAATTLIAIKELGTVPFLVSFTMSLAKYISDNRRYNVKVVILVPPGEMYMQRYSSLEGVEVHTTSQRPHALESSKLILTNTPTTAVLDKHLSARALSKYNTVIVLDLLKSGPDHILKGTGKGASVVSTLYAAPSEAVFNSFHPNNRGKKYFTSVVDAPDSAMFSIPKIKGYSGRVVTKRSLYESQCSGLFQKVVSEVYG